MEYKNCEILKSFVLGPIVIVLKYRDAVVLEDNVAGLRGDPSPTKLL